MNDGKIGVGIVGFGFMGSGIFEAIKKSPDLNMEVRAICRSDEKKLRDLAEKEDIGFATTNYMELVEREDVDLVAVFSPDHLHGDHVKAALKNNKHVVCTKPLATTMQDCEEIVSLARKKGRKFLTAETVRFTDLYIRAKKIIDEGELGKPIFADSFYVHDLREVLGMTPWRLTAPQDFLLGGVCHPVDLLRWLVGDVVKVHAFSNKSGLLSGYPLDDTFSLNLEFDNGAIGRVLGAYGVVEPPLALEEFTVFGTKGSLVNNNLIKERDGKIERIVLPPSRYIKMKSDVAQGQKIAPDEEISGHISEIVRFLKHMQDCIKGDINPNPDAIEGAKTVAVCLAAWDSIRTGKIVGVRTSF